jgi:predicted porin
VKPRTAVSADSTNLGIKGTYDLAAGLQVVFQCETGASVNGVSVSGICNRNSRIGLGSPVVGTLFFGNWDTPYRVTSFGTKADDPFLSTDVYDFESILTSPGFNTRTGSWVSASSSPVTSFAVRANNTVAFHSASFAGVSFKLAYAADAFKNPSGTQDPTLYSAALNYDRGPLSLMAGAERHEDAFALVAVNPVVPAAGGNPATGTSFGAKVGNTAGSATAAIHSSDTAWHVGAGYQLDWAPGSTTVGGLLEQIVLQQSKAPDSAVKRYDRVAWQVSAKHRLGDHELRARYSAADKGKCALAGGATCSTRGYGASDIAIGYAYYLAKAAQVYVYYTLIQNGRNAQYTFGTAGAPAVAGATPPGADPAAAGLGIRYAF